MAGQTGGEKNGRGALLFYGLRVSRDKMKNADGTEHVPHTCKKAHLHLLKFPWYTLRYNGPLPKDFDKHIKDPTGVPGVKRRK